MTTKPKAKKFRIRRPAGSEAAEAAVPKARPVQPQPQPGQAPIRPAQPAQPAPPQTAQQAAPKPPSTQQPPQQPKPGMQGQVSSAREVAGETDIEAIRKEGLTGRQLRMARRVAQKHGLAPTSDFDAVRMLRLRGIDPFQRSNMLDLVAPEGGGQAGAKPQAGPPQTAGKVQLPQTIDVKKQAVPSTEVINPAERRAAELLKIQRELAQRRRRKMALLLTRLAAFVMLPTLIAGYYFYAVATPMFSTKSEFLILKGESGSSGAGMGGLLAGTQFATNQDAIAVQSYLTSKDAMLRLEEDVGFKTHFKQETIDPLQRLEENPANEEAYSLYKRYVEIGYDPAEGVIRMEVMAADPQSAVIFSEELIGYAEERVDNLSLRKRDNAVSDAEEALVEAENGRREAQEKLVRMQQENAMIDPQARIAALQGQINNIEIQLQEKNLQLQALLDNQRPNQAKVQGAQGDVRRLSALLDRLNSEMNTATSGEDSLAEKAIQIRLAEADLATRDMMLQSSLQSLEDARRSADSQARYLTTSVVPVASQDPSYPRKFENTLLAFLIFAGVYLMISLTASVLKEQVSS